MNQQLGSARSTLASISPRFPRLMEPSRAARDKRARPLKYVHDQRTHDYISPVQSARGWYAQSHFSFPSTIMSKIELDNGAQTRPTSGRAGSLHDAKPEDNEEKVERIELDDVARFEDASKAESGLQGDTSSAGPSPPAATNIPWWRSHLHFATLCWTFFLEGWNDGTTGPLLPRIQEFYHVRRR